MRITKGQLRRIIREVAYAQGPLHRERGQSQSRTDALSAHLRHTGHPGAHVTLMNLRSEDFDDQTYHFSDRYDDDGVPTRFTPVTDETSWIRPPTGTHEVVIDDDGYGYVFTRGGHTAFKFYVD